MDFDRIHDFETGADMLDLRRLHLTDFSAFQDLARTNTKGDTVADFGNGDVLVIFGVAAADIKEGDFLI